MKIYPYDKLTFFGITSRKIAYRESKKSLHSFGQFSIGNRSILHRQLGRTYIYMKIR